MGASNFHKTAASKYFAVLMNYKDEDGNYVSPDQYEYDDLKTDVIECLKEKVDFYKPRGTRDAYELRSYPSSVLGIAEKGEAQILCTLRSGYYEGANLDYHELSDPNEIEDLDQYKKDINFLCEAIEAVYTKISMPLTCVATASNGESFYHKSE